MPPRRSTRAAAAAAAAAPPPPAASSSATPSPPPKSPYPLRGCRIAVSGALPGLTHEDVLDRAKALGAVTTQNVTKSVSHLITTEQEVEHETPKVRQARKFGKAWIVAMDWLEECEKEGVRLAEEDYELKESDAPLPSKDEGEAADDVKAEPDADPSPSSTTAPAPTAPAATANGKKRAASAAPTAKLPAAKKGKKDDNKPAPASPARDWAAVDLEPTAQKAVSKDISVMLDEGAPANYSVYIDADLTIWDASLNQTNATNNNNKFYRLQLLQKGGEYKTWSRWGRVGEKGQSALLGTGSLADALKQFEKKFKDKSGLKWEDRSANPKIGKYTFVERSYAPDSDDEGDDEGDTSIKTEEGIKVNESKLSKPVQDLMEFIFNPTFMNATMADLNYDAKKLPLGKLSKNTITRGFQTLKDLMELFDDHSVAQSKYELAYFPAVERLSNQYYSVIPHAFGRNRPPVIANEAMLRRELELLESLSEMKEAQNILKGRKDSTDNPADAHYEALGMEEMTPLDRESSEFKQLAEYLTETKGSTHYVNYHVEDIFRIERKGESDRFESSQYANVKSDRRLLWHGSRTTNYGGILSQGLRIAPPEAPVSGYMFGKGIYLADMSSKSVNYCCSGLSNGTALLLLCEAELGDPLQKLTYASYSAGEDAKRQGMYSTWGQGTTGPKKWKDAGSVHERFEGTKIPDLSVKPGHTGVSGANLLYNEFICYDVDQVRLRYLFRVRT